MDQSCLILARRLIIKFSWIIASYYLLSSWLFINLCKSLFIVNRFYKVIIITKKTEMSWGWLRHFPIKNCRKVDVLLVARHKRTYRLSYLSTMLEVRATLTLGQTVRIVDEVLDGLSLQVLPRESGFPQETGFMRTPFLFVSNK